MTRPLCPSAAQFLMKFKDTLQGHWADPTVRAAYLDSSAWSRVMLGTAGHPGGNFGLLGEVAAQFEYAANEVAPEYFRVDQIWWRWVQRPTWQLDVAIEHENGNAGVEEIGKLMYLRAPLRVVIGYPPMEMKDPLAEPRLRSEIQAWRDLVKPDGGLEGQFLLVLGPRRTWQRGTWTAYRLDSDDWREPENFLEMPWLR